MSKTTIRFKDAQILTSKTLKIKNLPENTIDDKGDIVTLTTKGKSKEVFNQPTIIKSSKQEKSTSQNNPLQPQTIDLIQQYLTVNDKQIIDIKELSKRHSIDDILTLLTQMSKEYKSTLQDIITLDITDQSLDETISHWFRLIMAINIIKTTEE